MEMDNKKTATRRVGRKLKKKPSRFRYSVNMNEDENIRFQTMLLNSGVENISKFILTTVFNREIKVIKIDKATMDYYIRLTNFYTQFQAIGNNYNQTVRALKSNFGERRALAMLYKLEKETIKLVIVSKEIIQLTHEYEAKWLQK